MTAAADKVWFITGASVGFGRALADEILARNGKVVATARNPAALVELQKSAPDRVLALPLDVTQPAQIEAAVHATEARFGRIDVLINNAGYGFLSGVEEASDAEIRAQFEVNFFGLTAMTRAVLPMMRRQKSGNVVNISSVAGFVGMGGSGYYSASKFAVEGLSEALSQELAPFGIGVLIVEPSAFRTEFFGRSMNGPAKPMAEYGHTADLRARLESADGQQAGDPKLAAKAIVDTVLGTSPPLRLLLGRAAFAAATTTHDTRGKDIEKCRGVATSVDFPAP